VSGRRLHRRQRPGGAMVASRLAPRGPAVAGPREGGYYTKDEFDMQEATAFPRLYQDRGKPGDRGSLVQVLQGPRSAGGTVVNWTTKLSHAGRRPRPLAPHRRAVADSECCGALREVEQRLGISKVDYEDTNPNNRAIYDGCKKLGWTSTRPTGTSGSVCAPGTAGWAARSTPSRAPRSPTCRTPSAPSRGLRELPGGEGRGGRASGLAR